MFTIEAASSEFKQIPRTGNSGLWRISVVGTLGSEKTTIVRNASSIINVPHMELDGLHSEPNSVGAPNDLFRQRVRQSLKSDSWVADGNYHQVRDIVWNHANTVVWLDHLFTVIMGGLAKRTLRRILTGEKLWNGNQEHVRNLFSKDSVFLWAIKTYRRRRRQYPELLRRPENFHLSVVRLRSPKEAFELSSTLKTKGDNRPE